MQRPWGRTVSGMLEEQLEPNEEREEGKAAGSGPCGPWENLGFFLPRSRWGAWRAVDRGGPGILLRCSQAPSGGCFSEGRLGAEETAPPGRRVWVAAGDQPGQRP